MPIDEYITNRLDNQQTWFSKKSGSCQTWYKRLRYAESACILLLPLIGLLTDPDIIRNILLVGIGALASYFRFFLDINAYHDLWIRYRLASEALKREKLLHATHTGAYHSDNRDEVLVINVERIIAAANSDWQQLRDADIPTPHSTGS